MPHPTRTACRPPRHRARRLAFCLAAGAVAQIAAAADPPPAAALLRSLEEGFVAVYERVAPAVVVIEAEKQIPEAFRGPGMDFFFHDDGQPLLPRPSRRSEGSGFIIRADGMVMTAAHVIERARGIRVKLRDGRRFDARTAGVDARTDIAVLKIDAADLPTVEWGDSDALRVGQLVCTIGVPYNLESSFTCGWVSAKGRTNLTPETTYEDYIQTDAFINPGNSGGPLLAIDGKVVGMNTLINGVGRGLGFAIPASLLRAVGTELIATGRVVRPWLGVRLETLDDSALARWPRRGLDRGAVVTTVFPDAPAIRADLRPADVVVAVDGVTVATAAAVQREVLKKAVGQTVTLGVWRHGQQLELAVTTAELPPTDRSPAGADDAGTHGGDHPPAAANPAPGRHGLTLEDVTPELAAEFGVRGGGGAAAAPEAPAVPGALVTAVALGSLGERAGVQVGDLLTAIGDQATPNAATAAWLLADSDLAGGVVAIIERGGQRTFVLLKEEPEGAPAP